jgi:CRP-like cAMP-binding protein
MSIQDDARQFTQIPFLANLEPRALELIAFSGETRIMRRGEILFRRGDQADAGYVVLSGRLTLDPGDGREPVSVLPGALVGEMALVVETERKATATVAEPSGILRIPRPLFHRVLRENPASAIRLRAFCAKRLTDFAGELDSIRRKMEGEGENGPALDLSTGRTPDEPSAPDNGIPERPGN